MKSKTIGLCLSGGGHRATAFSLGALLYLADAGLHRQVTSIASVSGGSIASGFFAIRKKPLGQQTVDEVEDAVRELARCLAGRPSVFWTSLGTIFALLVVWFVHLLGLVSFGIGFWSSQVVFLAMLVLVALLAGPLSGGTFWGWWGTWIYLGLILSSLVAGVAIWWSQTHWFLRVLGSLLAFLFPLLRCRVAEMAFAATVLGLKHGKPRLVSIPAVPRHIFCATEMHTGEHLWLSRDLVYVPRLGLGVPGKLTLAAAVQMSANFPVAFPYRIMSLAKYQFELPEIFERPPFLVVSDGGLYDNMATSWFREASRRATRLRALLARRVQKGASDNAEARLTKQIDGMSETTPDALIVVNSSEPYEWKRAGQSILPLWGELRTLMELNASMYNQIGMIQKRELRRQFILRPNSGAVVSIGEPPGYLAACLASRDLGHHLLTELELSEEHVDTVRTRAALMFDPGQDAPSREELMLTERIADLEHKVRELPELSSVRARQERDVQELKNEEWHLRYTRLAARSRAGLSRLQAAIDARQRAITSRRVPTTFRPLGPAVTGTLIAHGYLAAMINCHLLLDFPLLNDAPRIDEFERLARGLARNQRPGAPMKVGESTDS